MYIDFNQINNSLIEDFRDKFNLKKQNPILLYKITSQLEKNYDEFEKSICPYLFLDNIYYLYCADNIYKIISKTEISSKISSEDIIASIKLKISNDDILKMYQNTNALFTVYKNEVPQSQIKIISLNNTLKEKTLKYAYINGALLNKS